jgi:glycosyltransferase involved in cell wall biosynthesis
MAQPRITVVIPTYSRAEYLRVAIQSVLEQTYADFDLLVSDDASTDHTAEVVASFKDARLHYHRHPRNIGITPNWRFALTEPQTEFVAPLADDDYYLPHHLETALRAIEHYPQATYYTCAAEYFGDEKASGVNRPVAITDVQTPLLYFPPTAAVEFLGIDNPGPINCMLCRRAALHPDLFWGPPGYLPNDLLIMTQLMAQHGFVFANQPGYRFRVHATNTSLSTERKKLWRFNLMVWQGIRWLHNFLIAQGLATPERIEQHGITSPHEQHVVPLVLALASFDANASQRAIGERIFRRRADMDRVSARFRIARALGYWTFPVSERLTQWRLEWPSQNV